MLFEFKTLLESSSEPDEGFLSIALVAEYGGGVHNSFEGVVGEVEVDFNFNVVELLQLLPALFFGHWGEGFLFSFLHTITICSSLLSHYKYDW